MTKGTKERIVAVATELFGKHGYKGTSVRDVARAADVTLPTIYHYFNNKEGLYQYVLEQTRLAFAGEVLVASAGHGSVRDTLVAIGEAKHRFIAEHRSLMMLLMREQFDLKSLTESDDQTAVGLYETVEAMEAMVQVGIATGEFASVDVRTAAWCLAGVFAINDIRIISRGEPPAGDEVAQVVDIALRGLLPRG